VSTAIVSSHFFVLVSTAIVFKVKFCGLFLDVFKGEVSQTVTIQSYPSISGVLEGEERFQLQLVYADNNAVILPVLGAATVVIIADSEVSGTVSVMPKSMQVYAGLSQNGSVVNGQVNLMRTGGCYGNVIVSWQISCSAARVSTVFAQSQGSATFADMQSVTLINLTVS